MPTPRDKCPNTYFPAWDAVIAGSVPGWTPIVATWMPSSFSD
jgi:hypothetical protein